MYGKLPNYLPMDVQWGISKERPYLKIKLRNNSNYLTTIVQRDFLESNILTFLMIFIPFRILLLAGLEPPISKWISRIPNPTPHKLY